MSELILSCPKCNHHNPKLYVNIEFGVFNCFHCGFAGKLKKLYQFPELVSSLEDKISLSEFAKLQTFKPLDVTDIDALEDLNPVREIFFQDPQYDYLLNRGWTESLINIYKPLVSLNPKYKYRVILPVVKNDKIVYFTARSIEDHPVMKYKNPAIPRHDIIFESLIPENRLFTTELIICEGYFDAFKIPNAVALFGKTISPDNEMNILKKAADKTVIYVCLDKGAESWIQTMCAKLSTWMPNKTIKYIDTTQYGEKDLGELSEELNAFELINWIRTNSLPYFASSLTDRLRSRLKVYN